MGGRRSHSSSDFFAAQKHFVCLKEAQKQTLCSLLTSDMLDIASNLVLKPAVLLPVPQKLTQENGDRHLKILSSLGLKMLKNDLNMIHYFLHVMETTTKKPNLFPF